MSRFIKILFFVGDILLLNGAILAALYLHDTHSIPSSALYLLIYSNLAWLFLISVSNPYHIDKEWPIMKIMKHQVAFLLVHLLVILSLNLFFEKNYGAIQIGLIYLLFIPLFFLWKIALFYLGRVLIKQRALHTYIIIGKNKSSYRLRKYYLTNPREGRRFCGYFDYRPDHIPIQQVRDFCLKTDVNEIYCCVPDVKQSELDQLVNFGLNSLIPVKLILPVEVSSDEVIKLADDVAKPTTETINTPLDNPISQFIKRAFDIVFASLVVLLILTWLIPLLGLAIMLESPGPIFFTQKRNGLGNKVFHCIKFRTMRKNTEADDKLAITSDPRITRLGSFCRRMSIDEFPQFINVLMGSMSVVGPRPHMLKVTTDYNKLIEQFMGRQYVKPGITGLAQCLGHRGQVVESVMENLNSMKKRVKMDFYYIENWSFMLDIKIIFRTILSLIR